MTRVVVAGFGNPLRGDDGVGLHVAAAVAERWGERVRVLLGQQPVPEWAPDLASADVAVFVDASREAMSGLRLRRLEPADSGLLLDGHRFGPAHLLGLAGALYGHIPQSYLLLLQAEHFDFGETLSPVTSLLAGRAGRLLDRRLKAWHARLDSDVEGAYGTCTSMLARTSSDPPDS